MEEVKELAYKRKAKLRGKNRKLRFEYITQMDNLELADHNARKGKGQHRGVMLFDRRKTENLTALQIQLANMEYHTSPGHICNKKCPCGKTRKLHKLPYYPDHIVHHSLMQQILPVLYTYYYYDSYASVPGKGMHFAANRVSKFIRKYKGKRIYYVKLDFVKFYENILQPVIYEQLCKTFGNKGVRYLLREAITACDKGLAIGHYPIQPIANYYTSRMVRHVYKKKGGKVAIFVYCDDIVVMGIDKKKVWRTVNAIIDYAREVMHQPLHENIGMQIIADKRSLDFVGYQFFSNRRLLRKRMKKRFARKMAKLKEPMRRYQVATAYKGWLMHCNGLNLWRKIMKMKSFSDLQIPEYVAVDADGKRFFDATIRSMSSIAEEKMTFLDVEFDVKSRFDKRTIVVLTEDSRGRRIKFFTSNPRLIHIFEQVKKSNGFPFLGEIYNTKTSGKADYAIRDYKE